MTVVYGFLYSALALAAGVLLAWMGYSLWRHGVLSDRGEKIRVELGRKLGLAVGGGPGTMFIVGAVVVLYVTIDRGFVYTQQTAGFRETLGKLEQTLNNINQLALEAEAAADRVTAAAESAEQTLYLDWTPDLSIEPTPYLHRFKAAHLKPRKPRAARRTVEPSPSGTGGIEVTTLGEISDAGRCLPPGPGYEVAEYDTSDDDFPDVRKLFKVMDSRTVLVCREADLNGDSRKDIVRLYTDEGRAMREEADRDFDGQIDEVTHFAKGRISLIERDTTGNGVVDTRIFYEENQPVRAERDMEGRSTVAEWKPDRWEYFVDGRTVRIGTDLNGDGRVDRWDRDEEKLRNNALAKESPAELRNP